ncbi:hypothetical protein CDCA_CDCA14G3835 [Cyanidium caldarium]|uniref:DNA replication licensing factor MCM7 n=1 Tax=Cyanidium caldarium TaxID=2771 RepID=A0AAV9J0G4_CYACA|nr:hypothetical protein CDCA_CDCA14G3835 [Cyanidium caldarium]
MATGMVSRAPTRPFAQVVDWEGGRNEAVGAALAGGILGRETAAAGVHRYAADVERMKTFLCHYREREPDADAEAVGEEGVSSWDAFRTPTASGPASGERLPKYLQRLQAIANRQLKVLEVEMDDFFYGHEEVLARKVQQNTKRYVEVISQAADAILATLQPTAAYEPDTLDLLMEQREQRERENEMAEQELFGSETLAPGTAVDPTRRIPDRLRRRYQVLLIPANGIKCARIRELRAEHIGQLAQVNGIVTRVFDVKPMVEVAVYVCDRCGNEVYQDVPGRQYMPLTLCPSEACQRSASGGGRLLPQYRAFKYSKYQEVRIQEPAQQVPVGSIPRTLAVHMRGELAHSCSAGDEVIISGIFLPMLLSGFRALKAGLLSDAYLEATHVEHQKRDYKQYQLQHDRDRTLQARIAELTADPQLYDRMARSIAPEIYGHDDVKKALLLQLVGAPHRHLSDGMRMRGDLHICLMGDPGVAKSQLLRYICNVAPRGVYTTGKGSSGVGLTAAVMRDPATGDMVLEGGALVMADEGIACIDEFDKMDESDRTSIHEVMEQQTVSIAKAGITTTLNARAAVLAAANPAYGRYNRRRTPAENINMPAALLSRFDLLFLMLDRPHADADLALARHITHVHRTGAAPDLGFEPLSPEMIRAFIAEARRCQPVVLRDLTAYVVDHYVALRAEELDAGTAAHGYTTARTLLSVLRLSQALARLRLAPHVTHDDVDEAVRLLHSSKQTLLDHGGGAGGPRGTAGVQDIDPTTRIYLIVRDYAANHGTQEVPIADIIGRVLQNGFTESEFRTALTEYTDINIWSVDPARTRISFTL